MATIAWVEELPSIVRGPRCRIVAIIPRLNAIDDTVEEELVFVARGEKVL